VWALGLLQNVARNHTIIFSSLLQRDVSSMILYKVIWPMVIVGLSDAKDINSSKIISKLDYTIPYNEYQEEKYKNTMEQNYWTTKELIESNHKKYQDIIW
jgi:hypothetical protein